MKYPRNGHLGAWVNCTEHLKAMWEEGEVDLNLDSISELYEFCRACCPRCGCLQSLGFGLMWSAGSCPSY